jgi:hypothetical protein
LMSCLFFNNQNSADAFKQMGVGGT